MSNLVLSCNKELALKCTFERIKYQSANSDFKVIIFRVVDIYSDCPDDIQKGKVITAIGTCFSEVLKDSIPLRVTGTWEKSKYGNQLRLISVTPVIPTSEEGILRYLSSGIVKGVGATTAKRFVECFGKDTLKVLDENPERIKEVKGIGEITAKKIYSSWKQQRDTSELLSTICSLGLSVTYAKKALNHYGIDAAKMIKDNPYVLTELKGIGFFKADDIARKNGIDIDHPERIKAAILYIIENAAYHEGHCYLPEKDLIERAVKILGIKSEVVLDRLQCSDMSEKLIIENDRMYLKSLYDAELYVSERFLELGYSKSCIFHSSNENSYLTDEQRHAVMAALQKKLTCITGLPGTGKTTSIKEILSILENYGYRYCLAAPTGKAAKRMTEQTGREAKTIHRLLEFKKDGTFSRNKSNPLDAEYVIIDEASMIDIQLMASLLKAVQGRTSLILIGDYNQLPPVGPGNLFRDIVDRGLCYISRLVKIHRQAEGSTIIRAAHIINEGKRLNLSNTEDFIFRKVTSPEDIKKEILREVSDNQYIQVLSPMKKGTIGTIELNKSIRELFFSLAGDSVIPFNVGDRVIQKYNNYEKGVFNGEIGFVTEIDIEDRIISVAFDNREIYYEDFEFDELDFAYALTVHKSQGSEYDCVVIPVSTAHYVMLFRNLLYTAVTRARGKVILIGTDAAVNIAIRNNKPVNRYTSLGELC